MERSGRTDRQTDKRMFSWLRWFDCLKLIYSIVIPHANMPHLSVQNILIYLHLLLFFFFWIFFSFFFPFLPKNKKKKTKYKFLNAKYTYFNMFYNIYVYLYWKCYLWGLFLCIHTNTCTLYIHSYIL